MTKKHDCPTCRCHLDKNDKTCALCGGKVHATTGSYLDSRLVHKKCRHLQKAREEIAAK